MATEPRSSSEEHAKQFERFLVHQKSAVEAHLRTYLAEKQLTHAHLALLDVHVVEKLAAFTLGGGKRIRAALVAIGFRTVMPERKSVRLVCAQAAVELLHAFLLAHDDIFDRDLVRHGQPSLHHQFNLDLACALSTPELPHIASSLATIGGDIAGMYAFDCLMRTNVPAARIVNAARVLAGVAAETGLGEALDILATVQPVAGEDTVTLIQTYKTAKYSFEGPLHIGAILAGASTGQLSALGAIAVPLGIAFQIQDDILGVFGRQDVTGKPVGADIREGKRTLLTEHALAGQYAAIVRQHLGDPNVSDEGVTAVQEALRRGGSLDHSHQRMRALFDVAQASVAELPGREESKRLLLGLIDTLSRRDT